MNQKIDTLYSDGKVERAIHLLVKAIDDQPRDTENYLQLATYLVAQNSPEQARELLEKGQRLVDHPEALSYDLAVTEYLCGKMTQALNLLNQIPNDDATMYQKALVYLKIAQPEKALAFSLSIKHQDEKVLELQADCWLSLGEMVKAKSLLAKIPPFKRTTKVWFLLGIIALPESKAVADTDFEKSFQKNHIQYEQLKLQYQSLLKIVQKNKKES